MRAWITGFVGRIPTSVHTKLLAAFLVITVLLVVVVDVVVVERLRQRFVDIHQL